MKLVDGIKEYIGRKRSMGITFSRAETSLMAFSRSVGDVDLRRVDTSLVMEYLSHLCIGTVTWRQKYYLLLRFCEFWFSRGEMPELLFPPPKLPIEQVFVPHIFSRTELRLLFRATRTVQSRHSRIAPQTLRTFFLFLYGTGALVGEVLRLQCQDIDLAAGLIVIGYPSPSRSRRIPIGNDLCNILETYMAWRSKEGYTHPCLFIANDDSPLNQDRLKCNFNRIRRVAVLVPNYGSTYPPRMNDLKFTFAVHRITSWIRDGIDLNLMLPALAAYMGQVGLGATERYLAMTPERFQAQLKKLSPTRRRGQWNRNRPLMKFLAELNKATVLS